MNRIKSLILPVLLLLSMTVAAQDDGLKLHYDFSVVSGTGIGDASPSGVTAQLKGVAQVVQMGKYHVLDLGNGTGYLDMTSAAGSIVSQLTDFTVSVYYRVDTDAAITGAGNFLWAFSKLIYNTQTEGPYSAYRINVQRMASSASGWGGEVGMEVGTASVKGSWVHVAYRQRGQQGELFVDGKKVQSLSTMPILKDIFTEAPANCWIGRPPFAGDNYLKKTLVADFRLYDVALGNERVAALAATTSDLEHEYRYGTPGDFTQLRTVLGECRAFLEGAMAGYAPNALAELRDAVSIADAELAAARASQHLIDSYVSVLQKALAQAKASEGFMPKSATAFLAGDHGFRHPGGVNSQADFERIKQLLAAGDERLTKAWNQLCANEYAQSGVATWPVETIVRGGSSGQNYMNAARGAAMAYQNALRWKIAGTKANADAAVRILMAWAKVCKRVGGDTNQSLAAGLYGYAFAQAAELMRDYEGWSRADFEAFKQWMINVWYNRSCDFIRRRHNTWQNTANPGKGERPGHYWSNWGLCNVLCIMSIGVLCDDVHMYNQGVSFYKYDHVGTYTDRSSQGVVLNDGCNEFIGNLVPVVLPDSRGPLGYLGQMQESGRDQGHALMALGLALDVCQMGYNQGDDLYAYMDDRIAAGIEHVAALNFGGVAGASLPWINYNYADCRGTMGAGWMQTAPNEGGKGGLRPFWDRALGYYEGVRGIKLQYAGKASERVGIDGGGGNYGQTSGGFDHLGFSTLTSYRPLIDKSQAPVILSGDILYKGEILKNHTNLGGLKYNYAACKTKAVAADGADITLMPQLPAGVGDNGSWQWNTGATTRQLVVKADRSYVYRVTYTADNGVKSEQAFSIAVEGDCNPDTTYPEITVGGAVESDTVATVLYGSSVALYTGNSTGWTNDYLWDNGVTGNSAVTIPAITASRTYTCQYANQGGAVSECRFNIRVVMAKQYIQVGNSMAEGDETRVLKGSDVVLSLVIPDMGDAADVVWQDGSRGLLFQVDDVQADGTYTATYLGEEYVFNVYLKTVDYSYLTDYLTTGKGYSLVASEDGLARQASECYFVMASDDADLLIGLKNAPKNGNKALFFQTPCDPLGDFSKVWTLEPYSNAYGIRNIDYDGLLIQTEWNAPYNMRTHDQPYACEWTRFKLAYADGAWTVENGKYEGNWMGLWTPANGYVDGEEIACNKTGDDIAKVQLFAVSKERYHRDLLEGATLAAPKDATVLIVNPSFEAATGAGWELKGSWGNQRYNGAAEVWHSTNFSISQTVTGLPDGLYTLTVQMCNGEGSNTGYLYAESGGNTATATVSQSCAGSAFSTERDKMAANASYGKLSVDVDVEDGTLTMGIKEPSAGTTWLVFDNFVLTYHGSSATGIEDVGRRVSAVPAVVYDLQGRKVCSDAGQLPALPKGIYIVGGKKILK